MGFGYATSAMGGRKYTWQDAAKDAGMGCVFAIADPFAFGGEAAAIAKGASRAAGEAAARRAGESAVREVADAAVESASQRYSEDQDALIQLAKEAKRKADSSGGISEDDAKTLIDWANEYGVPNRGPEAHPGRGYGRFPHIHIGGVSHIRIR